MRKTIDHALRCRTKANAHDAGIGGTGAHGGDGSS